MESSDSGDELLEDVVMQICNGDRKSRKKSALVAQYSKPELSQNCEPQPHSPNDQALIAALSGICLPLPNNSTSHLESLEPSFTSDPIANTSPSLIYVSANHVQQCLPGSNDNIVEVISNTNLDGLNNKRNSGMTLPPACNENITLSREIEASQVFSQSCQFNNILTAQSTESYSLNGNDQLNIQSQEMGVSLNNVQSILSDDSTEMYGHTSQNLTCLKNVEGCFTVVQCVNNEKPSDFILNKCGKENTTLSTLNENLNSCLDKQQTLSNNTILENMEEKSKSSIYAINMHDYCIQSTNEEPQLCSDMIFNLQNLPNEQSPAVKCPECNMPIVRRNFRRHLKEKHNLLVNFPVHNRKEIKPFLQRATTCPECYMLVSRKNMKRHLRNIHKMSNLSELEWKGKSTKCPECHALVASKNLRKHLKYVHKILHYIRDDDIEKRKISCPLCNILFCPNSLKKHLKLKHNVEETPILSGNSAQQLYKCQKCSSSFAKKISLRKHMRLSHNVRLMNINCREENCTFRCEEVIELGAHLEKEHGMPQDRIERKFASLDEFESWKVQLEKETDSRFVKHRSSWGSQKGATVTKYYCNRSGYYVSKSVRKRKSRTQGSCKMSGYCTAFMYIIWDKKTGAVQVTASSSHYGHNKEYEHLSYKNGWITIRVAQEMTANEKIFDNVKDSLSEQNESLRKRINKEIQGLSLTFGMRGSERHANENLSLTLWITEMKNADSHSVLYAKLWNEINNNESLDEDDLVIVLQTPIQAEMLKRFGQFIVSIDLTIGTSGHNCFITCLSIVDESGDGFPVAWCISSKNNNKINEIFFKSVAQNVGPINCKWLICDGDENYHNLWVDYFKSSPQKIYCPWHIDQVWRKKLGETVEDVNEEILIYKKLQILKDEPNIEKFNVLLKCIMSNLCQSSETFNFGLFFKQNFINNAEQWAFCYRSCINSNTNNYLECVHQVLKYIRLRCKLIRRIDHVIVILLKYVRDKAYERLLKLYEGKTGRIHSIYNNHIQSLKMSCSLVKREKKGTWKVTDNTTEYYVTRIGSSTCRCPLHCPDCPVCVHEFYCSCLMSLIQTSICKHIHLVRRYNKKRHGVQLNISSDVGSDSDFNEHCAIDLEEENLEFLPNIEIPEHSLVTEAGRNKIVIGIRHLCTYIQNELGQIPTDSLKKTLEKLRKILQDLQTIKQKQKNLVNRDYV